MSSALRPPRALDVELAHQIAECLRGASYVRLEARVSETHTRTQTVDAEALRRLLDAALADRVDR